MNERTKEDVIRTVRDELFAMQDKTYRDFHSRLMPTVDKACVIGIRTPNLRKYAKQFATTQEAVVFMEMLPHKYYEENNLHAFLIEQIKDYKECVSALNRFLPYVDNWATCDFMTPKIFKKYHKELLTDIRRWLVSEHTYEVRFAIGMLMKLYLDEAFLPEYPQMIAKIHTSEYYINMMVAWYFATALAKQYEAVIPYIEEKRLDVWIHNKTIQKAIESYRICDEKKVYLRTLKCKES